MRAAIGIMILLIVLQGNLGLEQEQDFLGGR